MAGKNFERNLSLFFSSEMKNIKKPHSPPLKSNNDGNGDVNGGGADDEDGWMLRSYDDFLQQSLECGSFINYKPVKTTTNMTTTTTNNRNSSRSQSGDEIKKESNEMEKLAESPTSVPDQQQLVLIKYKNKNSDGEGGRNGGGGVQKRREIHSLLFFVFFLFVTIITLSQIIVMHSQTSQSSFYQIKLMQEELKLMDASIDRMLKERHVLPMQVHKFNNL